MNHKLILLRISYWIGAIVDAKAVILFFFFPGLIPVLTKYFFGNMDIINPSFTGLRIILGGIVLAWTFLLIWADRKPLERKMVLLLTIFPICITIISTRIYNLINNYPNYKLSLGATIFFVLLTIYFIISYVVNSINLNKTE